MKKDLESILTSKFNLNHQALQECIGEHKRSHAPLVKLIAAGALLDEESLLRALAEHLDFPFVSLKAEPVDVEAIKDIPPKIVTHYQFMPLGVRDGIVRIAVSDPLALMELDEIRLFLGRNIEIVLATGPDILDAIKRYYGVGAETIEAMQGNQPTLPETREADQRTSITDEAHDPSVIKLLNQVVLDAIHQRATDIHFEPFEDDLRVRYRIDGILYEVPAPAAIKQFQSAIATRIKVMANLDIAERRRPQDGRVEVSLEDKPYDLRISFMPTPFGESIGIRILPRSIPDITLENLGLTAQEFEILNRMVRQPHGIILVTGPTGSGKTTTLYSCLNRINSAERKIITIEDPIEYKLKGITQMQVDPKIGFTFSNALRSMLRHDPDVMMVGEIRDTETSELAVRTSLTGHLVFSTLHTNDASSGITRLIDMGVDPFLISTSVNLIIAQRLVRLICPQCKEDAHVADSVISQFADPRKFNAVLKKGKGCEHCRMTGYRGRTGIFEMLIMNDEIKNLVLKKVSADGIRDKAVSMGMRLLKDEGWEKAVRGLTTIDEVIRVTHEIN